MHGHVEDRDRADEALERAAVAVAVQDDRRPALGDRLGEAVAAEVRPQRRPLPSERRRRRRVVQQRDPDRAPGDLLQGDVERAHLRPGLRVDRPQERLAEVRAAPSRGSRRRSPSRPRAPPSRRARRRSRCGGRSRGRRPASSARTTSFIRFACQSWFPSTAKTGTSRPRHASASTAACSGSPWVVRSPASRTRSARSPMRANASRDLGAVALVAVDVAGGGDLDG